MKNILIRNKNLFNVFRYFNSTEQKPPRQKMVFDVVIVGGGIAGLSAAIKLKQQQKKYSRPISVCVIEKGAEIGNHIISGNCFQPRALDQLFPDWRNFTNNRPPIDTKVSSDEFFVLLNQKYSIKIPPIFYPRTIDNHDNYLISLGKLCGWLAQQATQLGVDIFTGTSASQILYNQKNQVIGIATGDSGISKSGKLKQNFQRGIQIQAKQTVLAEGARGSLTEKIIEKYKLRRGKDPQIYGIGLKQIWEVDNQHFRPGRVQHTVGWPLPINMYGGSFIYHMKPNRIHIGMVVGLDYKNPYINPYEEFQRLKNHPAVRKQLEGGQCVSYGARALNEGGFFSIPKLIFPGGLLVGCAAGFLNVMKIKGAHNAMKSGIEAGESIYQNLINQNQHHGVQIKNYQKKMESSWVWEQLHQTRNFKNSFHNIITGFAYSGLFKLLKGRQPFDLRKQKIDSENLQEASKFKKIEYPKHDRIYTFDLLDNLSRANTDHEHDQPSHLVIKPNKTKSIQKSLKIFDAPEERFCPAKVYQFIQGQDGKKKLQINAQNCIHCKTCSIKMIDQYIDWRTPEGSGGPQYNGM